MFRRVESLCAVACWIFLVVSTASGQTAPAANAEPSPQTPQAVAVPRTTPHDRLAYATEQSSLQDVVAAPWHLKLDVTVYDDKGEAPQNGTIEYWQKANAKLSLFTFGAASQRTLELPDKIFESKTAADIPQAAHLVLQQFLHPGPYGQETDNFKPVFAKQKFSGTELDCVMLEPKTFNENSVPLGSFSTYCLSQKSDVLRISYRLGSAALVRNRMTSFMGKDIALDLSLARGDIRVAEAKSTDLASFTPADAWFEPDATMKEIPRTAKISSGIVAGLKLSGDSPRYPDFAKQRGIQGTVVLHAMIGKDGHIHSLQVVSSPLPELSDAAEAAVRTWTYRPYLLLGKPVEVDTTIAVNFNLR